MSNQKDGLDYFPLDVNIELDDKFALIQAKYGITGYGVILKMFTKIYGDKGYFYDWNENTQLLFSTRAGVEFQKVVEIISDAIRWEIFDEPMFKKHQILTSKRIQETFLEATKRRKSVELCKKYLLVNGENVNLKRENVYILAENVDILNFQNEFVGENVDILKQSKVKESKVKESILSCTKEIIEYLNKKTGKKFLASTDKTKELIRARFNDGFLIEDFKKVIDNKVADWKNTEWEKFIRPITLFGTKFESYLNEKPKGGAKNENTNRSAKRFENERLDDSEKAGFYANVSE